MRRPIALITGVALLQAWPRCIGINGSSLPELFSELKTRQQFIRLRAPLHRMPCTAVQSSNRNIVMSIMWSLSRGILRRYIFIIASCQERCDTRKNALQQPSALSLSDESQSRSSGRGYPNSIRPVRHWLLNDGARNHVEFVGLCNLLLSILSNNLLAFMGLRRCKKKK